MVGGPISAGPTMGGMVVNKNARMQFAFLAAATFFICAPASAAGPEGSGVYIGLGAGASRTTIDNTHVGINAAIIAAGFSSATTTTDKYGYGAAYKAFAGYSFNKYVALELGYFNLGKFKFDTTTTPAGTLHAETKTQGANLDAVFSYPFDNGFSVFGRIGIQYVKSKVDLTGTGAIIVLSSSTNETGRGPKTGVGVGYEFARNMGVRGEWEYYRVPDGTNTKTVAKVDVIGLSLYYRF